jgi:hypothetical protein
MGRVIGSANTLLLLPRLEFRYRPGEFRLADEMPIGKPPRFVTLQSVHGVERCLQRLNCLGTPD